MSNLSVWRSLLFVPAHIERFVAKAHTRGADGIILDLEDSVPLPEKATARTGLVQAAKTVSQSGGAALVRINQPWRLAVRDLEAAVDPAVSAIVAPKANSGEQMQALAQIIDELETEKGMAPGHTRIIAQIESADALPHLDDIATAPRVMAMILGSEDFSASVGMEPNADGLMFPNQQVLMAARRAGIQPMGFVGSIADFSDLDAYRETIRRARRLGFCGAFAIHPSQVAIMNEEFMPSADEIEWANGVIEAFDLALKEGRGAAEFRGKMIDMPVVIRAREILALAKAIAEKA